MNRNLTCLALGFALAACAAPVESAEGDSAGDVGVARAALHRHARGAVFTLGNEAGGNEVIAFARDADGMLGEASAYATGGLGSGDSLGSQGALVLSSDRRFLIAVNAGSNDVTSFAVEGASLRLIDRVPSGGARPTSVTERLGLVYVLNAQSPANVSGFALDRSGRLRALAGATAALSADDVGPGQVQLSSDARTLVVTERTTHMLDSFAVGAFGRLGRRQSIAAAGTTPFGFDITKSGKVIVSEAASRTVSSYAIGPRSELSVVSPAVASGEAAPCWLALSQDERFAFVANAGAASISAYSVARDGALELADPRAGELGEGVRPLDLALSNGGRFLYVLDRGHAEVIGLDVEADGALAVRDFGQGLPAFASGVAAY